MPLTNAEIRAAKPRPKAFKLFDEYGLYLEITPTGSKLWRLKYRFAKREKRLALGAYPEVPLAEARRRRYDARKLLETGVDPSLERKRQKAALIASASDTFEVVANEYLAKMEKEQKAPATIKKARWFLSLLKPTIGRLAVREINPQLLLAALRRQESKGNLETAKKVRSFASRVFRYAVSTGRADGDPAQLLKGALTAPNVSHYSAILDAKEFGSLLRDVDRFSGYPATQFALKIAPHVFLRPGELRKADWSEINFEEAVWSIPAVRMKARRPHVLPLSKQVTQLLKELHEITGPTGYIFPAFHTPRRPMSENTLNAAFRRLGYSKDVVTAHGLRATASTLLNESGNWSPDAIERALAHGDMNAIRGTYHRGQHWDERVKMAQWWSDYLCQLKG